MLPDTFELPRRAMAIFAHPDDVDFGASGTLAAWADRGVHITYCLVTSGQKGTHDAKLSATKLARIREREQMAAGAVVGAKEFVFLRRQDGETEVSLRLRGEVCKAIRIHKPDVVLTHDPWRPYQVHPDHRVAGWSALDGVIAARDHLFFPEQLKRGLIPHRVTGVYLFGTSDPNIWFDIAGTLERKITAISSHTSQVANPIQLAERMRASAASNGRVWGLEAAEAFRSIEIG